MRFAIALLAVITGVTMTISVAEAQQRKRSVATYKSTSTAGASYTNPNAAAEKTRADSRDPSGQYRGYPDWARSALSPQSGPSGR